MRHRALIYAVGALLDRNYFCIFTRAQAAILVQYLIIACAVAAWQSVAWFLAGLVVTAAADVVFRPEGWWERRGAAWLQSHTGRSETSQALAAGVPFTVWAFLALVLDASASGFVAFGLVFSALLGIGTWAGAVLRSKKAESEPAQQTCVPEGRAMVYVGPTKKQS
jgi:hypothetical protein